MKILLLGATGYLGGNIASRLLEDGHDLICVVRRTSDTSRLPDNEHLVFISNEPGAIELAFKHNDVDWVINSVTTYKSNDSLYGDLLDSNIIFPLTVFNLAIKYHVRNYLTIGTSLPRKLNLYSFAKEKLSEYGEYLAFQDGISFADLKLEMFYGGCNEPKNRFLSYSKEKMKRGEKLELTDGYQNRDIIRVEDVVSIISRLLSSNYINGYMKLPVGSGESHTIREVMSLIKNELHSDSILDFGAIPLRDGEPDTIADISWYKDINYQLKFSYIEGLLDWCRRSDL